MKTVFRDEWLVVVDKPSGLPSQPRADRSGTDVLQELNEPDAALVHRLDQPASGLLVVALHPHAAAGLSALFRDHDLERVYRAVLAGTVASTSWTAPLDGQSARTDLTAVGTGSGFTAAELRLHTGRTHQIRKHAALAGHAIAGDRRHGGDVGHAWPRLALHAWRLRFVHPVTGATLELTAPVPEDLALLWSVAGGPA